MWTSYDTGMVQGPFRPEHVRILSLTHALAVTGKVLVAALEAFPSFSKSLQYVKVCTSMMWVAIGSDVCRKHSLPYKTTAFCVDRR